MAGMRKTSKPRIRQREGKAGPGAKAIALGTLAIGAIAGAAAAAAFGIFRRRRGDDPGHVPTDLMGDAHPGPEDRAIDAFRPDPTAPIPDGERDAFRPAPAGAPAFTLARRNVRESEQLDAAPS